MIATHQLYHARNFVSCIKKAWESKKSTTKQTISPTQVQRGMINLLAQLPAIKYDNKPRGIPIGNQIGCQLHKREDQPIIRKTSLKPPENKAFSINFSLGENADIFYSSIKCHKIKKDQIPDEINEIIAKFHNLGAASPVQPP